MPRIKIERVGAKRAVYLEQSLIEDEANTQDGLNTHEGAPPPLGFVFSPTFKAVTFQKNLFFLFKFNKNRKL